MNIEELRQGNLEFMIIASRNMAQDSRGFFNTALRTAMRDYSRERYDGLQELQPSAGYLFVDGKNALSLIEQIHAVPELLRQFQAKIESNLRAEKDYVLNPEGTSIKVPFERVDSNFSIGLTITGYTMGEFPFEPVENPLSLRRSTRLERSADIIFYFK